ncbi:MAG: trehalose-6-phosphate synthase [Bacteroidota bacterium]|nr:trehalose-6-phosphate synthase [Bacteroidota bacterium]
MKITLRLIVSLIFVAALVATIFSYYQVQNEEERLTTELTLRASTLAESMEGTISEPLLSNSPERLKKFIERFIKRDPFVGIAIFDSQCVFVEKSPNVDFSKQAFTKYIMESTTRKEGISYFETIDGIKTHIYTFPLRRDQQIIGSLILTHNASYIESRLKEIWRNNFVRLLILSFLIILTTILVVRWSLTGPIAQIADWLKGLRMGKIKQPLNLPRGDVLGPLANEVTILVKNLALARASAEVEARLRAESESLWTAERLKEHVRQEVGNKNLYVISNREPYMHQRRGGTIECIIPAGGLVTAIDPIMRSCGGTWIAHGSGDADLETSDRNGKIPVPPEEPNYTLKRVWLTKEEEEGYYYGFSNEGIWPLCHHTHTRPIFRLEDWIHYQKVNEKFAEALLDEIENEEEPLILIQDYHFALLPFLIKSKRPDARVAIFWHIPWPNPEAFGICPWKREILLGLLAADLVSFQIQYHCNNFLDTIDRFLESKINWEQFSIERQEHITLIKPFPISVAFPAVLTTVEQPGVNKETLLKKIMKDHNISVEYLGVGVDRIDYTKGIIERFRGLERFFEKYPEFIEKFSFIELGAPSRTHIKRYHDLLAEVEETANKINWRFQTKKWKPIIYLEAHHNHDTINRHYKAADLCMVTSLHDGMNLVAKEYVAARDDEDGALILSQFTGAARELHDAFIVNPYDVEEVADSIHSSLTMPPDERKLRMQRMQGILREHNVYRWAANLVATLSRIRLKKNT